MVFQSEAAVVIYPKTVNAFAIVVPFSVTRMLSVATLLGKTKEIEEEETVHIEVISTAPIAIVYKKSQKAAAKISGDKVITSRD